MNQVAVIILNWNGEALLRRFLPTVVANTPAGTADVIVADNGSTDGSLELLAREFPAVEVLAFAENHGFAGGYNRAVAATRRRYTVLLNSDVAVGPGWLEPLVDFMESHPRCGACQPKIHALAAPGTFEYAGAAGGFLDRHGYPYCRGRIFGTLEADRGQYDADMQVHWASGAALMVRTAAYEQAGGLDPAFFAHMEEIDLCWRMRLEGWQVWAVGASAVSHLGGGSLPQGNPRKTYLNFRNNLLMLHRNLPPGRRAAVLLQRRLLDAAAFAQMLLKGDFAGARAIIRAHRDYRRMAPSLGRLAGAAAPDLLAGTPSVLAAYYLRRRRTFGAI